MTEIWLHSNRRAHWPLLVSALSFTVLACVFTFTLSDTLTYRWLVWGLAWTVALGHWLTVYMTMRPRLAYDGRRLRMNVGFPRPVLIPIELVEGFFLGKGPAYLKGKDDYKTETSTLIVRVAERAPEWEKLPTDVRIAAWCGHHITLRGTWTEPLSVDVANRLNQRLYDVQQAAKSQVEAAS